MNKLNLQNTNCFRLFIILTLFFSSILSWGQTDLVRWDNTNLSPTILDSNISSTSFTFNGGVTYSNQTWSEGFFETGTGGTWASGVIDLSKYIEFSISANTGYQINLSNFSFYHRLSWNSPTFQVRYSKDNFATYHTAIGNTTSTGTWASASGSLASVNPVLPGQIVKVRIYVYNTSGATFHIRRTDSSFAPKITGTVSAASPPAAVNDNAQTAENIPVTINILGNDTHSTLSSINITQQPANGQNITVNGTTNVTYTPNNGYTGADSFKYTLTDGNGTSNEATVNINVIPVEAPTAIADNASVFMNQVKVINVLANDSQGSGAFDEVSIVSGPANGSAIVNPDNTISYTPANNYTGSDVLTYNVTNIHNATSNTVAVNINITNPVGLVRWNGAGSSLNPAILVSNITASPITNHGGVSITTGDQWNQHFQTNSYAPKGSIVESKYIQFTIAPNSNYKLDLNQFNFEAQMDGGSDASYEVRYSKNSDFSLGYSSFSGTISTSWGVKSGSLSGIGTTLPGETVYIRLYVYNTDNSLRIRHSWGGSTGPTITGVVSPYIAGDPADLGITLSMDPEEPNANDEVTITVEVENFGPNDATGVVVNSQLPAGFSYISDNSGGDYNPGTGVWEIGDLEEGNTATLVITVEKEAVGPYTFSASVSHNGADANSVNDSGSITPTNACADCTNTITTGTIVVGPGEVYCLHSGTWSDGVHLNGGTICIGEGATFSPAYIISDNPVNGTIINRGTMNFNINNNKTNNVHIINYGQYNTTQLQNISGTIENYGTIDNSGGTSFATGGNMLNEGSFTSTNFQNFSGNLQNKGSLDISGIVSLLSGAEVVNEGIISWGSTTATNITLTNHNSLVINSGLSTNGGYWDNRLGATMLINIDTPTANMNFIGDLDNSGLLRFGKISVYDGVFNNYGHTQVYNSVTDIATATYLTNDDLLEFIDVPEVQFNGPMLTNNGTISITHGILGNFKMNQANNEVHNNGLIQITGEFQQNMADSNLFNNCSIQCLDYFAGNGNAYNEGVIIATRDVKVQGNESNLVNGKDARIQGVNFTNTGYISGSGSFYFTGTTTNNNDHLATSFVGLDPSDPIEFYDVSTAGIIFDEPTDFQPTNTIRPDFMLPANINDYECSAPPTSAGTPPITEPVSISFCEAEEITFDIDDYAVPSTSPVLVDPFVLLYNSIRLFEYDNPTNPTNNTTQLEIDGKGTLSVDTTTGIITFSPDPDFVSGTLQAEYRISNKRTGDPITYPSARTMITISLHELPDPVIEEGVDPVCIGNTISFSIDAPDATLSGVWQSSNPLVATVDSNGVVTGISTGTAIISYTATLPSYPEGETCELVSQEEISVYNCACYKNPNLDPADQTTITGISAMQTPTRNWPEVIPNGFLALESSNKGLVITRVANSGVITDPQEGMIIYDIADKCIKLYNGTIWHCIEKDCN